MLHSASLYRLELFSDFFIWEGLGVRMFAKLKLHFWKLKAMLETCWEALRSTYCILINHIFLTVKSEVNFTDFIFAANLLDVKIKIRFFSTSLTRVTENDQWRNWYNISVSLFRIFE